MSWISKQNLLISYSFFCSSQKKTEKSASKAENENPAVTKSDSEKSSESAAAKGSSGVEMTASQEDSVEKKSSGCNTSEDAKTEERDGNCYW